MNQQLRIGIFALFLALAAGSTYFIFHLKFSFDFEQFFPQGDDDLNFFKEFTEEFEADDNFMLLAIHRSKGVFNQEFLNQFHDLTIKAKQLPHVLESQSLTKFEYPLKTPFGITTIPAIHRDDPSRYASDSLRILQDERFVYNLISPDGKTLVVFLKTVPSISLWQAQDMMSGLDELMETYSFESFHYLGRPYFQKELVDMQKREILVSALVSGILVTLIMIFIYRRFWGIFIALLSVGLGMLIFMGILGATGRELNAMAALYPVLMIIVGTSDVVHIMSKYIDELRKGRNRKEAVRLTVREIGLATLLTSLTTAIGFASLLTSRVIPIRDFGINSAMGVLVAYLTVVSFTVALLSMFDADQLMYQGKTQKFWHRSMDWFYRFSRDNTRRIALGGLVALLLAGWGISMISTNYTIINNMPRNKKITEDFQFFEKNFTGFRPLEFAITAQEDYNARDYAFIQQVGKLEDYLSTYPSIRAITSVTALYKSLNQMHKGNRMNAYELPENERTFKKYQRMADRVPQLATNVVVSKNGEKARITSRILDIGADSIKTMGQNIDQWVTTNLDTSIVQVKRTGTGLIIDKNAEYIRRSLLQGLGMAILIVSLLMVLLFRNVRMLLISLIPNIIPLILAGALLGFLGIELEAGVSIVFAVIFGIAVDDTIHFLSKYKLSRDKGMSVEEALQITFTET
ncbi:MAG: MMPL family transporter, partial [Bacteroidota bacterium]